MNERIKEFWDKAAESTAAFPSGQNNSWETQVNFMEKFAELIVEECRYVMDCNKGSDQNPAWNQALSETSLKIKQHFGVEE